MHSAPFPSALSADQLISELALAVARNNVGAMRPLEDIVAAEGLTMQEFVRISDTPVFKTYVTRFEADLHDSGFTTRTRAKLLMQALFPTMFHMAQDSDVPAAARVKIFENFAELADEKPKNNSALPSGSGFSITINLPGGPQNTPSSVTIEGVATESTPENRGFLTKMDDLRPESPILITDPDDYEYAGDDVYE